MKTIAYAFWAALSICLVAHSVRSEEPRVKAGASQSAEIARVEALLDKAFDAIARVQDYTGTIVKRERFGDRVTTERLVFKFARPFKVYVKRIEPTEGQEAIYIEGWNGNKMRAHLGKFPDITANINPRGRRAMKGNHHPITSFGLERELEITAYNIQRAIRRGDSTLEVSSGGTLFGEPVSKIDVIYAKGGRLVTVKKNENLWELGDRVGQDMFVIMHHNEDIDSPNDVDEGDEVFVPNHYAGRGEYFIGDETGMLLKASSWDHMGRLYESYGYPELQLNPGLTAKDFDPDNEEYDF